ncbi:DUF6359 domain-containing protein [Paraprevotella clara]|uniref:DUF6359 domain-containing protein n=1 Tax=Paraprevotella clara TaxID=454154 RepID=UPI00266C8CB9|nr:DUF6359 domain-containing protein [Paraprevotella clara]
MTNFTSLKSLLLAALLMMAGGAMAQDILLSEDFSKCTGVKDPDNPTIKMDGKMDDYTNVPGWTCVNGYAGEGNTKFGTASKAGSVTTPSVDLSDATATYTLKFRACAWNGGATTLKITVDDQEAVEVEGLTNSAKPYAPNLKEFSVQIKGTSASKITIASSGAGDARFFLDDIEVTKLAAGQTQDPHVAAPSVVAFGVVGTGLTATEVVEIKGTDLTDDLTVAVSGNGFTCPVTSIAKDEAANASFNVVFTPTAVGDYEGKLTISGGGLKENVEIALSGSSLVVSGEGTKEVPFTVGDVFILNNSGAKAWVEGYIVGSADGSLDKAVIGSVEGAVASNMLIAASADETDVANCVPVQLSGDVRSALNLVDNPGNLFKSVKLYAALQAYFSVCGLKSVTEYELEGQEPEPEPEAVSFIKATKIESGKRYAWVYNGGDAMKLATAMKASQTYGYIYTSEGTEADAVLTGNETNAFTFTATDGGYTIMDNNGRYLYSTEKYPTFNVSADVPESGHVWAVDLAENGEATITCVATGKWVQYDTEYNNFAAYAEASANGVLPMLYVESDGSSVTGVGADASNAPVEVYTLGGVKVGSSLNGLQKGIYIIKQGGTVKKVMK